MLNGPKARGAAALAAVLTIAGGSALIRRPFDISDYLSSLTKSGQIFA